MIIVGQLLDDMFQVKSVNTGGNVGLLMELISLYVSNFYY